MKIDARNCVDACIRQYGTIIDDDGDYNNYYYYVYYNYNGYDYYFYRYDY